MALNSLVDIQRRIEQVRRFLSVSLNIANAHTVEFYTHDVWNQFMAVEPESVLSAITSENVHNHKREPELSTKDKSKTIFGFCKNTKRLVDTEELLEAAKAHSLPGLGICMTRDELLQVLGDNDSPPTETGAAWEPDEFMNSKKSHEVQCMSEVVACLAQQCKVKQVIDVGSGKGYLSSFLSLQHGLRVYGIDSSSVNTHGAHERIRKLKKFSKAYQRRTKAAENQRKPLAGLEPAGNTDEDVTSHSATEHATQGEEEYGKQENEEEEPLKCPPDVGSVTDSAPDPSKAFPEPEELFLSTLSLGSWEEAASPRVPPGTLSSEERERRKRENLERKARGAGDSEGTLFSPLTSYVTAETELRELISELQEAVLVGLHTCGDLSPSSLRMFVSRPELTSVCAVGCCYHLLSEEFDPAPGHDERECSSSVYGFPMSQYLRSYSWFCGRNARMSACLALERVSMGQGIQMESLFYRAVLHVILRDHYGCYKSEKRVGNIYSKANSFEDYVRRALRKLELDESKLSKSTIQLYYDTYRPRMAEMHAFNTLKVTLAPCIEGLILLDRLCYLKEQEEVPFSALVQLFDPVLSPRCYATVGVKNAWL